MSVKFVSKNSNFMVVLKPGVPGSTVTGQQPQPGIYVRFQGGMVDVHEEAIVEMLRKNRGFGVDYVEVAGTEIDPYEHTRQEIEPGHNITEINYGHVGKSTKSPQKQTLTPELKKVIENEAIKILPNLLKKNPKILKDILAGLAAEAAKDEDADKKTTPKETTKEDKVNDKKEEGEE